MERQEQIYKALFDLGIGCSRDDDDDPIYDGQDMQSAFYRGAEWADKNPRQGLVDLSKVWHPAEEEPRPYKDILTEKKKGFYVVCSWYNEGYGWKSYVKIFQLKRWAYIEDLLPKGGEQ